MSPQPLFEIHPETGAFYGLSDGDLAEIETRFGRIRLSARFTRGIRPDTIHIPQGWEGANANELTGLEEVDPHSGFPNLKSLRCLIRGREPGAPLTAGSEGDSAKGDGP
jgi:anaerobic selenocysteine-containing dehydrogenase